MWSILLGSYLSRAHHGTWISLFAIPSTSFVVGKMMGSESLNSTTQLNLGDPLEKSRVLVEVNCRSLLSRDPFIFPTRMSTAKPCFAHEFQICLALGRKATTWSYATAPSPGWIWWEKCSESPHVPLKCTAGYQIC